ncbi:hypothetical protein APHAL10511_002890 [Amanita phalloides]|nr:hypothetical protein APHAL10511_002890 [Amanita phalloides]
MPVTTRSQRARQNQDKPDSLTIITSGGQNKRTLRDGTVVRITTSDTGKGKHWRWIYPEMDESAQSKSSPSPPTCSDDTDELAQQGGFITPVSTMQTLSPSIQCAPRRREKHHPRPPDAVEGARRPLASDNTIPWERDLNKTESPGREPVRQALGPHGTWLVNDEGNCAVTPIRTSPSVARVTENEEGSRNGLVNR